jgi:hypothetical protein
VVGQGGEESRAVTDKIIQDSAREMEDRDNRKNNLIWFGVPESGSNDLEERKEDDRRYILNLGKNILELNSLEVKSAKRLGRKGDNARPLLTTMGSTPQVYSVLKQARAFSDDKNKDFNHISVKKDMTPLERKDQRKLVIIRNQKREESKDKGTDEVWVIRNGKVIDIARKLSGQKRNTET